MSSDWRNDEASLPTTSPLSRRQRRQQARRGYLGRFGRIAARAAVVATVATGIASVTTSGAVRADGHPAGKAAQPVLHHDSDALTGSFAHTVVAATPTSDGRGFWLAYADGTVVAAGDAKYHGEMAGHPMNAPVVGIAATSDNGGYWLLGADGGVFTFGDAPFLGSTGNMRLNAPALQMLATPTNRGYYFVAGDGGIFTFGDARFYGSTGNMRLNRPVVGMAGTPTGGGYWLVASDGGIFTFGNAGFYGSTGAMRLNQPVVGMARTHDGHGYWMVARDGGVFTFGDAGFHGSGVNLTGGSYPVGIVATGDGGGYWMPLANGAILHFGDAPAVSTPVSAVSAPAPTPPAYNPQYSFEVTNSAGAPVRWDPCEVIHYSVVYAGAPASWQSDVNGAISQLAAATGLDFVLDGYYGSAGSVPSSTKVTIEWAGSLSGGDLLGLTNYWYYLLSGYTPQMVSAKVTVLSGLPGGFSGYDAEGPILLHELGHAVGLGHTPGDPEVMNPINQGFRTYQPGDLNGLWGVGANRGCAGFYS